MFVIIFVVGVAFGEIIGLSIGFPNVVELVLIEGTANHNAAHLQKLVVLLMEIPLLASRLLSEEVDIDGSLDPLIRFFLILTHRIQHLIVLQSISIYLS